MGEIIKKTCTMPTTSSKTCYNHFHPLVYPIEYEECPGCGTEKITRMTLEFD